MTGPYFDEDSEEPVQKPMPRRGDRRRDRFARRAVAGTSTLSTAILVYLLSQLQGYEARQQKLEDQLEQVTATVVVAETRLKLVLNAMEKGQRQ